MDFNRSLRKLQLHALIVEVQKGNTCLAGQPNRCAANVQFTARIVVRPQTVASRERTIRVRINPIAVARDLITY